MDTRLRRICPAILWFLFAVAISGCGGVKCAPVTGTITLDGEVLSDAKVSFMPEDDLGIPTMGATDAAGVYTLRQTADQQGAPAGSYTVRITTYREGKPDADPPIPGIPERVPPQYNLRTTLSAEVGPEENKIDFDLKSKP